MDTPTPTYEHLIDGFIRWATANDDIRATFIIGSRARSDHPADVWSDLDLLAIADAPERRWGTTDWLTVRGGADGKGLQGTSPAAYSTSRVVGAGAAWG